MKTFEQIQQAMEVIRKRVQTPGLSMQQIALLSGMLNALVWVADDSPDCSPIERLLAGEPLAAGQTVEHNPFVCPKCRGPMAHSRLVGRFCPVCSAKR